mmetsp:Transcript_7388/g.11734  ORF Transcript_7388/g.11734 Transcript_7388/m.11734 type:complete len:398 (-) Transcript_7388:426-1619(-)
MGRLDDSPISRCLLIGNALLCMFFGVVMFSERLAFQSDACNAETSIFSYEDSKNETTAATDKMPSMEDMRPWDAREDFAPTSNRSAAIEYLNRCISCDISDAIVSESNALSFPANEVQVFPDCFRLRSFHNSRALLQDIVSQYGSLWVSYLGDSRIREPYVRQFDLIAGRPWRTSKGDYHQDRYYCCFDLSDPAQCYHRVESFEFNGSVAEHINKDFSEISETGERRLRKGFCASWQWRNKPNEMSYGVSENSQPGFALTASAFVMNPGVHAIGKWWYRTVEYKEGLDLLIQELLKAKRRKPEVKIVFHGVGATNDEICRTKDHLESMMIWIDRFDTILKNKVRPWLGIMALHDIYRYTRFSTRTFTGDCVHWNGDYFQLLNQLDFNAIIDDRCLEF